MSLEIDVASEALLVQRGSFIAVAAFFAQTWDWVTHLSDEIEYIWVGNVTTLKVVYMVARYVILVGQLVQQILTYWATFSDLHVTMCRVLYVFRATISQLALNCVEIVLLFRVYTLYNQSYRMRRILCGVFIVSLVMEYAGQAIIQRVLSRAPTCYPPRAPTVGLLLLVSGALFCHMFVFSLTVTKVFFTRNIGMTPLASVMLKEGMGTCSMFAGILVPASIFGLLRNVETASVDAAFAWYLAILSIIACRLIIQLRKLAFDARKSCDHDGFDEEIERLDPTWTYRRSIE